MNKNAVLEDMNDGITAYKNAATLINDQAQEIEDLKQRLHYLKDQRDDLNDDLIESVDIVLKERYCVTVLINAFNKFIKLRR